MIKADKYLVDTLKELKDSPYRDQEPRAHYKDGEPAHSRFITQKVFKYDISKGEFPINTLRNTAIKGGINEVLTIYQCQENTQKSFLNNNVKWWEEWMNEEGNLGKAYSYNLESQETNTLKNVIEVQKPTLFNNHQEASVTFIEQKTDQTHKWANIIVEGKFCNFKVLGVVDKDKYSVQLLDCGLLKNVSKSHIRTKNVKSPFYKSIGGVGYYGDYKVNNVTKDCIEALKDKWAQMFERCLSKNKKLSNWDISMIDPRWHNFSNFLEDVVYIPQFFIAKRDNFKNWVLDKDYYGCSYYSRHTSVFITVQDNQIYSLTPLKLKSLNKVFLSHYTLAQELGISQSMIAYILCQRGKRELTKRNKTIADDLEYVSEGIYRYELSKNQINDLLINLQNNKFSRRHMLCLFNWQNQHLKTLVECAFLTKFTVKKLDNVNYIDVTLTMRSSDYVTAGSINAIQYVALTQMICGHLNKNSDELWKVGNFMHIIQNLHVYERHMWALDELLSRTPKEQPTIRLLTNKNFYDYTIDDFEIILPQGIEKLSKELELAV